MGASRRHQFLAAVLGLFLSASLQAAGEGSSPATTATTKETGVNDKVRKTDDEWKKTLTPEQFSVLRKKGTERAFTGSLWNLHDPGVYACAGCGQQLFASGAKFDSGTGWPSFSAPLAPGAVATEEDRGFFSTRTEVHCSRCDGHLGHVFPDGPAPTGLRYCINSVSLQFEKAK